MGNLKICILIIITNVNLYCINLYSQNDSIIYYKAIDYIITHSDSVNPGKSNGKLDKSSLYVSPQIVKLYIQPFARDLKNYKDVISNCCNNDTLIDRLNKEYFIDTTMIKDSVSIFANEIQRDSKFILFFSQIRENLLFAQLEIYDGLRDYRIITKWSFLSETLILFIISDDEIKKMYFVKLAH